MQLELERILRLQASYDWQNTPAMAERGRLIRFDNAEWIRERRDELSEAIGVPVGDFLAEGRDATGRKTRVPWTRFGSRERSPSATADGFYVVYLFARDGSAVFLSLNQGTTDFDNGAYVRKDLHVLSARVEYARVVVASTLGARDDIVPLELRDEGERSLGRGYELGEVASIAYPAGAVPADDVLSTDALDFARALGRLYDDHTRAPIPYEVPELTELEEAADVAAGKPRPARGKGFRQSKEERDLIEHHAVKVATAYYVADGWNVKPKGAPYDLELRRGDEKWTVEVKGTTSMGEAIPLTAGEVRHHATAHPNNALVIVRGIILDRTGASPVVRGGVLFERHPWDIAAEALSVISYKYAVAGDMYEEEAGYPAELLLG